MRLYLVRLRLHRVAPNMWFFFIAALWLLSVFISDAYPWGNKGHEIVAAIAETQLTNDARRRIRELLPQGTTLADASTWPDKAGRKISDMDPYHFINFPKDPTHTTSSATASCAIASLRRLPGIAWYVQVLKSPDAPRNEKRIALRFVAHLIPDIHQPLHAGFAEDRGGNSVDVRFNGRKENLHSLWDTALVELEQGRAAEIAARIQAAMTTEDRQQWQQGTPADWALESLAIVRAQVYRLPVSGEITARYTEAARAVIRTRLAQSGARLAWLLNEMFQE